MAAYTIGCDAHKRFSQFTVRDDRGQICQRSKVDHVHGAIHEFLSAFPAETPVALESVGNWYWLVDEVEAAGCQPHMAHAARAKVMMGHIDKTDKLDADGLSLLLHNGTLPSVWIPPGALRDERELPRTRMALCKLHTAVKNRIHATLAKYALSVEEESDAFSGKGLAHLKRLVASLPPETQRCVHQELEVLEQLQAHITLLEERIRERTRLTPSMQQLKTLPGIGDILAIVIDREVGTPNRFPTPGQFAGYSGTVPKVQASGGKTRHGRLRSEANRYLKWAFIEAANGVVRYRHHPQWRSKHVSRLYERIRHRKGHAVAVGAVARHLAEAAYWVLKKGEPYREPRTDLTCLRRDQREAKLVPMRTED